MKNKFLFTISILFTLSISCVFSQTGDGSLSDKNIEYVGRWDKSSATLFHSYWGGAYFRTSFTGKTVKIKLAASVNIYVSIDGKAYTKFTGANGTVNLTPTALADGTHTLVVAANFRSDEIQFQGLILDAAAITIAQNKKNIIEFIGNSITCGEKTTKGNLSSYAWLSAENLQCDHTQIAYSGITLVDGYRYTYNGAPYWGQSLQYFSMKEPTNDPSVSIWDYTKYTPKLIVINLGTNDKNCNVPAATFQAKYIEFLTKLRNQFPTTEIIAMRAFNGSYSQETQNAINIRVSAGDTKVHFIDTNGWLISTDFVDGTHPTDAGHIKVTQKLNPLLNYYLVGGVFNGDFELDNSYSQNMTAWSTISSNGKENSDYVEFGSAHSGSYKLVHWNNTPYNVFTYQTLTGLANGNYSLKAWVRSSGGQTSCSMIAQKFGSNMLKSDLPTTETWTQISIPNIQVTNGQCEIGFSSDSPANAWCNVDSVEFSKDIQSGTKEIAFEKKNGDFKIYPSPTKDFITIEVNGMENPVIKIFDLNGRKVYQSQKIENNQLTLNVNNLLNSGIYNVSVIGTNKSLTDKLVVK